MKAFINRYGKPFHDDGLLRFFACILGVVIAALVLAIALWSVMPLLEVSR